MFSEEYRDAVRDQTLLLARSDPRVVAGAVVGSLAFEEGDRWSDLDLTFAVADGFSIHDVLEDWTRQLTDRFGAIHLFDISSGAALYRVFLLSDCLQFDLSFAPASEFGAAGPKFKLLFGRAADKAIPNPPPPHELLGYAVHHALRARFCIERGRLWHAEYWISGVRHYALSLACRLRDLPARYGRGFDDLPAEVRDGFLGALACSLERGELRRALSGAIAGLLREIDPLPRSERVGELAAQVEPSLRKLTMEW